MVPRERISEVAAEEALARDVERAPGRERLVEVVQLDRNVYGEAWMAPLQRVSMHASR